jgi:molybdenum cofactor guanylyltransferase
LSPPLGVVLAGGAGKRIGGDKCTVELAGRPLLLYPIQALRRVCEQVVVVAKQDTALPQLAGEAEVWVEPDEPRHPLAGVVHALRMASARRVVVLACGDVAEPLCAVYTREALKGLEQFEPGARATDVVEALGVAHVEWGDANAVLSVNAPEDLLRAQALL